MPDTPEEVASRNRALELNKNKRLAAPITAPTTPQASLQTVLTAPGSTMIYSEGGSGGAILVMPGPNLGVGAAIKVEDTGAVKVAQKCSQMMDAFFQNATGTPPFAAPRVKVYTATDVAQDPDLETQIRGALVKLQDTPNAKRDGFKGTQKAVDQVATGKSAVMMMEFAEGKQVNRLPLEDKLALMKSEAFAQSIGRAMAPTIALGLSDHAGTSQSGSFKANISNFMYSPQSGTLSVIDYDTGKEYKDSTYDVSTMRMGARNATKNLEQMRTFLEKAGQSQENFEAAVQQVLHSGEGETPFSAIMKSFNTPGFDSMFMHKSKTQTGEVAALNTISEAEMKQFAANLLVGAADGMGYVQQNLHALQTAVQQTHEVDPNGNTLEHFHTQEEMKALSQEMAKLDAPSLKVNLEQCLDTQNIKERNQWSAFVADLDKKSIDVIKRLNEVQAKIDRIENPTAVDRLKSFFGNDKARLQKLNDEKQQIAKDLSMITDLKNTGKARLEFHDEMQEQSRLKPPVPKVNAPGVSANDNNVSDTTKTGLGTKGQEQEAPHKAHVGDVVHLGHHAHSNGPGEGLGPKTGEKAPKLNAKEHHSLREDHPELVHGNEKSEGQSTGKHVK